LFRDKLRFINSSLKNIFKIGTGNLFAQGLAVISLLFLTRLYSPDAFSGWALWQSVATLFTMIATLRYELAVVLPKDRDKAASVFVAGIIAVMLVSLIAMGVLQFAEGLLVGEKFIQELHIWIVWMPIYIISFGLFRMAAMWFTREKQFGLYTITAVALPFTQILCQVIMAQLGIRTSAGMILGTFSGQLLITVLAVILVVIKNFKVLKENAGIAKLVDVCLEFKNYPLYMTPFTLVGAMRDRIVYFFMSSYASKAMLGFYNLSFRVMNVPNTLLSGSIRPVLFQKVASEGVPKMAGTLIKVVRLLMVGAAPLWALFLLHNGTIFALVFGEPWREAGQLAAILSIAAVPLLLGNWMDRLFDVLGRQRLAFSMEISFSALSIAAIVFGMLVLKDPLLAIIMQTSVLAVYYWFWLFALFRIASFPTGYLINTMVIAAFAGGGGVAICMIANIFLSPLLAIAMSLLIILPVLSWFLLKEWNKSK
jgi:lipopolysaccharide exporter